MSNESFVRKSQLFYLLVVVLKVHSLLSVLPSSIVLDISCEYSL